MTDSGLHYPMSCPFCGSFPNMGTAHWSKPSMCVMRCGTCGANGPLKMLPGEAARAWDEVRFRRRATDRDYRNPDDDDDDGPEPKPVTPKLPETVS